MFQFSSFLTWMVAVAAGVLLSVIQALAKEWPALKGVSQKMVAIALALVAGGIAALFEFGLGVDLFSDITTWADLIQFAGTILFAGQAAWALTRTPDDRKDTVVLERRR